MVCWDRDAVAPAVRPSLSARSLIRFISAGLTQQPFLLCVLTGQSQSDVNLRCFVCSVNVMKGVEEPPKVHSDQTGGYPVLSCLL